MGDYLVHKQCERESRLNNSGKGILIRVLQRNRTHRIYVCILYIIVHNTYACVYGDGKIY
jgi:hypothetical protein